MAISEEGKSAIETFVGKPFRLIRGNPIKLKVADGPDFSAELRQPSENVDSLVIARKIHGEQDASSVHIGGTPGVRAGLTHRKDGLRMLVVKNYGLTITVTSDGKISRWEHFPWKGKK